jgi:protein-tyrosine phosphatase
MHSIVAGDQLPVRIGHAGAMAADHAGLPAPLDPAGEYRICLVCLGNICRSPTAEVVLRDELAQAGLDGQVSVESAGTGDWHLGEPMDARAAAELARRGYDGSGHVARQFTRDWLPRFDLVVVMDARNLANVRRLAGDQAGRVALMRSFDPAAGPEAEVPDPYDGGPAEYAQAFDLIQAAAKGLTARLAELLAD